MKRQAVVYPYPPCAITAAYPILQRIPPEERAAWVAQAERGEALSREQRTRLGLHPDAAGSVLVPADPAVRLSPAQLNTLFPPENQAAAREIVALGLERAS